MADPRSGRTLSGQGPRYCAQMVDGARRRRRRWWATVPFAVGLGLLVVVGGPVLALVAVGLALQVVVAVRRSPDVAVTVGRWWQDAGGATRWVVLRGVPTLVGAVALLMALDWGLGVMIGGRHASVERGSGVAVLDLASVELPPTGDPRVDADALADAPWADRYFAELEALDFVYEPFIGARERPVRGRYIATSDGVRESYQPPGAEGDDALEVWFFGGSTMWGEGQRDEHTIPSEVARIAEAAGTTIRAVNFGERGYTAFQEFLVFEQALAGREPPDVAVFYHGINEFFSQVESPVNLSPQPSVFQLSVLRDAFALAPSLPGQRPPHEPTVALDYAETSAVNKLLRGIQGLVADRPASADDEYYAPPPDVVAQALDNAEQIYRRSLDLIRFMARKHDVPALVFWQPHTPRAVADPYYELGERAADEGIDISDAFEDVTEPILIDGAHTNELGARLAAGAIWDHLGPALREVQR